MRIVQIIDSLESGGAEKMAVSFANSLVSRNSFTGLITTRREGNLKAQIHEEVNYLFLKKRFSLDLKAVLRLRQYCKVNAIQIIHAHSSSYFIACLVKMTLPKIKIVWHDHNGVGNIPKKKGTTYLQIFSIFFKGIISVNTQLETWAKKNLFCQNVIFLPNFVVENKNYERITQLHGVDGKRVLYLANLRHQKNHFMFVDVVKKIASDFPDWTYHLVGMDFNDSYSAQIKQKVKEENLEKVVFFYGSRPDVENIINQSNIAVFTSNSEGLPVALLEYGLYKMPIVSTRAGEIPFIVEHSKSGFISEVKDVAQFSLNLSKLMLDESLRKQFGEEIYRLVSSSYTEEAIIEQYQTWLKKIL